MSEAHLEDKIIESLEACQLLRIHRNTLYKLIHAKELPAFRYRSGAPWKFRKSELEQWLSDQQFICSK